VAIIWGGKTSYKVEEAQKKRGNTSTKCLKIHRPKTIPSGLDEKKKKKTTKRRRLPERKKSEIHVWERENSDPEHPLLNF